jgi:hypothetical protein
MHPESQACLLGPCKRLQCNIMLVMNQCKAGQLQCCMFFSPSHPGVLRLLMDSSGVVLPHAGLCGCSADAFQLKQRLHQVSA